MFPELTTTYERIFSIRVCEVSTGQHYLDSSDPRVCSLEIPTLVENSH